MRLVPILFVAVAFSSSADTYLAAFLGPAQWNVDRGFSEFDGVIYWGDAGRDWFTAVELGRSFERLAVAVRADWLQASIRYTSEPYGPPGPTFYEDVAQLSLIMRYRQPVVWRVSAQVWGGVSAAFRSEGEHEMRQIPTIPAEETVMGAVLGFGASVEIVPHVLGTIDIAHRGVKFQAEEHPFNVYPSHDFSGWFFEAGFTLW